MSTGVFAAQAASQGYIGVVARERRSTAASLYITVYYAGGGLGAVLPAAVWSRGGWPAVVALTIAVQAAAAALAFALWTRPAPRQIEPPLAEVVMKMLSVATAPIEARQRFVAIAVIFVLTAVTFALLPNAQTLLPAAPGFVPSMMGVALAAQLVTAYLLMSQFLSSRLVSTAFLGGAYLVGAAVGARVRRRRIPGSSATRSIPRSRRGSGSRGTTSSRSRSASRSGSIATSASRTSAPSRCAGSGASSRPRCSSLRCRPSCSCLTARPCRPSMHGPGGTAAVANRRPRR